MIEKIFRVNGNEFTDEKEALKYEAELKQKELERQERLKKLEEERKTKQEAKEKAMKRVKDCVDLVNQAVKKYEEETGDRIYFITENGKLRAKCYTTLTNGLVKDFFDGLWF